MEKRIGLIELGQRLTREDLNTVQQLDPTTYIEYSTQQ